MDKSFVISHTNAVLDFSLEYCTTSIELLESAGFENIVKRHLSYLKRKGRVLYLNLNAIENNDEILVSDLIASFKLLLVFNPSEIKVIDKDLEKYFVKNTLLIEFIETLYNYWRSLERYAILHNKSSQSGLQNSQFVKSHNDFESLVLETYRKTTETLMGYKNRVYRQLIAGVNAGIIVNEYELSFEKGIYEIFKSVPIIESIILHPPFITYPRKNTRDGIFNEIFENPLLNASLNGNEFLCYPALVGKYYAMIYFHKDFMAMGITLANLFELAPHEVIQNRKPDIIYAFGIDDGLEKTEFYHDKENDIFVGYASYHENIDYFGYMKKMVLTLHNVKGIENNGLPLHGAMANIIMEDNSVKNIVIIGDSGAGKSETLEALRTLEDNGIKEIKVVFDDMGIIFDEGGKIKAYGTEIGAFVRLDDLDTGYAYREIDRSIFMNPNRINARIVIPIATYDLITEGHSIDMLLYANNYDDSGLEIELFNDVDIAKQVFIDGARFAKGTTTEIGLVKSYFANPFGPVQRKSQTDVLINKYFNMLYGSNIKVGQIKTRLGIKGFETSGPNLAARSLLEYLKKK